MESDVTEDMFHMEAQCSYPSRGVQYLRRIYVGAMYSKAST
jgi:hypothetical protein